ncbi:MAG: UDP-N-acetylmuramoylalanyl-D-glutamyl-2, 6-diaminopimelate--D-alanyl-D-alanine ligase [Rhodospirillaceae bacterium]|nr:UDP-N-acetylmuramoylalanyl-D-glutamyl-2, 6-diaminopimelate--D-alanyl-D-alanine ligase [Rhodospirillaceae bacterium]
MTPLWTSKEVITATNGTSFGSKFWQANGISIDTRTISPGNIFIAIIGENIDGHNYIDEAFEKGASAAIISKKNANISGKNYVLVRDTFVGLNSLAKYSRSRSKTKVIAITGSVGKTSTKEILRSALSGQFLVYATEGNLNNHLGVPLTLARMPVDTDFAILELGMNKAGEIRSLSKLVKPDFALITSVEAVHLEFFDSIDDIADAKGEIFEGTKRKGFAIINLDSKYFQKLSEIANQYELNVISFGSSKNPDVKLLNYVLHEDCTCVTCDINGLKMAFKIGVPGLHVINNSLSVLAIVNAIGGDLSLAGISFSNMTLPNGRGNRKKLITDDGEFELIDESYNASPVSMKAALQLLGQAKIKNNGRRIAVLGDMLELGQQSLSLHQGLSNHIKEAGIDMVFSSGKLMESLYKILPENIYKVWSKQSSELTNLLISELKAGDVVMVKGSFGSGMGKVVRELERFYKINKDLNRGMN